MFVLLFFLAKKRFQYFAKTHPSLLFTMRISRIQVIVSIPPSSSSLSLQACMCVCVAYLQISAHRRRNGGSESMFGSDSSPRPPDPECPAAPPMAPDLCGIKNPQRSQSGVAPQNQRELIKFQRPVVFCGMDPQRALQRKASPALPLR